MVDSMGFSAEEWQLWRAYRSAHGQLARALDRELQADADISQADFGIMASLFEAPEGKLRVGQLAEALAWEKSRVSHQVSRMETRGLLERSECDLDARGTWIGLTAEGRRTVLGAMRQHAVEVRRLFIDVLTDEQRAVILQVSERVLDTLNPELCEAVATGELPDGDAERDSERAVANA